MISASQQELNEANTNDTDSVGSESYKTTQFIMPRTDPELMKKLKEKIHQVHVSKAILMNRFGTNPLIALPRETEKEDNSYRTAPISGYFSIFSREGRGFL